MHLVMALLQYNPFGPTLEEPRLAATLDAHQRKLDVRPCLCPTPCDRYAGIQH